LNNDFKTAHALLKQGQSPGNRAVLDDITVGLQPFVRFFDEQYLSSYIACGGSKIKFVTGKPGSGKTHFIELLSAAASDRGFSVVNLSAREMWLHDFKDIYSEIFNRCDLLRCLRACAGHIAASLGVEASSIAEGTTLSDYLSASGEFDALTKREIRNQLQKMFLRNPLIDNNFAAACSLITGGLLGHPSLEEPNRDQLLAWMSGSRDTNLAAVRKMGLSPTKVTKYNARHMLRSLIEVLRLAGIPGLLVIIDHVDILLGPGAMDTIRYTKLKRDDTYQNIRELIDEIDTLKNIMFIYAFDRKLIDDTQSGIKSYNALWLRIQNEIVSNAFNQFTDIIDMDTLGKHIFTEETLTDMSHRFANVINTVFDEAVPIDQAKAGELMANAPFAQTSLPRQVGFATLNIQEESARDRF